MRRIAMLLAVLVTVVAGGWWLTPPRLVNAAAPPALPGDLDSWLADSEAAVSDTYQLIHGTEKRLRWQDPGRRTAVSVVYLHGFSATRQETAPTSDLVADRLAANLFETRLSGHGHGRLPMDGVSAEQWLADGVEAIGIGAAVGDDVVVIGTSTGATLALALSGHPVMERVSTLVLISPNIEPADPAALWLTRPGGPLIARFVTGDTRSWQPHNALQGKFWSTRYPTDAVVEVMRLVDLARVKSSDTMPQALLMLLSPDDTVISPQAARRAFESIDSGRKKLVEIRDAGDPSNHVLAGAILSPGKTEEVAGLIVDFVRGGN